MSEEIKKETEQAEQTATTETAAEGSTDKTYTQAELTAIISRKSEKQLKEILATLGVTDLETGKKSMEQLQELLKSKMSKEELLTTEKADLEKRAAESDGKARNAEIRLAAYDAGVAREYVDDVIKLLPEGDGDIADRLKDFLSTRPIYLAKRSGDISGATGSAGGKTKEQETAERLRAAMGLVKK